jgi:uncharacterized alpha/beta hydrolase family protein
VVFVAVVLSVLALLLPFISSVTITLKNVAHTANLLTNMIANGNLVLEAIRPTLMITGSGGANTAANTITFNFSAAIKDGSFAVDDIGISVSTISSSCDKIT